MALGIIYCPVLEAEVKTIIRRVPGPIYLEQMEWGLHTHPESLLDAVVGRIRLLQDDVKAIMLGYGRCQAMDNLPRNFKVPVFYPKAEDCIGILLGQERYQKELQREAGTWFLTPGWTKLGMEFIFRELQLNRIIEKGIDPLEIAHRMLRDYTRGLFIDMKIGNQGRLQKKAREIADEFGLRLEITRGSLAVLEETLDRALESLPDCGKIRSRPHSERIHGKLSF